jgi:hypothetical protein
VRLFAEVRLEPVILMLPISLAKADTDAWLG